LSKKGDAHCILPRDAMLARYMLSPCSVSLSVTSRNSVKSTKYRITKTTSYDSSVTLVFDAKGLAIRGHSQPETVQDTDIDIVTVGQ